MKDRIGEKYGRLEIVEFDGRKKNPNSGFRYYWLCKCDCGNTKSIEYGKLQQNHTRSCGCLKPETNIKVFTTHGLRKSAEYNSWSKMIDRCTNSKNISDYKDYGGRGISVCEKWLTFSGFIEDMGMKPNKEYSIDRIDVNGNYNKENCKWSTPLEQANNKRNNVKVVDSITGKEYNSISEAARAINMQPATLWTKLNNINKNTTTLKIKNND